MQAYLNDQVFDRLLILRRVLVIILLKTIDCEDFEVLNTLISLFHLQQARLVVTARHHLAMLDLLVLHSLLMSFGQLNELFLINPFRLILSITLALNLNFKGFLVSILSHHALQFEGITV